jgi:hypothetical protein
MALTGWKRRSPYVPDRVWEGDLNEIPAHLKIHLSPRGRLKKSWTRDVDGAQTLTIVAIERGGSWILMWALHQVTVLEKERARRTRFKGVQLPHEVTEELLPTNSTGQVQF